MKKIVLFVSCCLLTMPAFSALDKISVIGSSNTSLKNSYAKEASKLASSLAGQKKQIFCVGTGIGTAGAFLRTLINKKASYSAYSYQELNEENCPKNHPCQTAKIQKARTISDQMQRLITEGDAIIFLPGGFDVMYAFNYLESLIQNDDEPYKPVVFLNTNHFWDRMNEMLVEMSRQKIISKEVLETIAFENNASNVTKTLLKLQKNIDNIQRQK